MADLRRWIARVAATPLHVLITGETGTGKELVATAVHAQSPRASRRFLCLTCAALPETLIESELFGYDRGAFTGAHEARTGLLRSCDGGTLFLDEVGELSLAAQAKLLRVVEAKEVSRLGDGRTWPVDFRLVAATNRNLEAMVRDGLFRKDLFYRLSVACIDVPPLRARLDDIPALVTHCLAESNHVFGVQIDGVSHDAMRVLTAHSWPGNVRELRNVIEAAYITCGGPQVEVTDLPRYLRQSTTDAAPPGAPPADEASERERLLSTLASVRWNKSRAASLLHWSRMTLYRKLAKHGLTNASADQASHTPPHL